MGDLLWALFMVIGLAEMLAAAYLIRAFRRLAAKTDRIIAVAAQLTEIIQGESAGGARLNGLESTGETRA